MDWKQKQGSNDSCRAVGHLSRKLDLLISSYWHRHPSCLDVENGLSQAPQNGKGTRQQELASQYAYHEARHRINLKIAGTLCVHQDSRLPLGSWNYGTLSKSLGSVSCNHGNLLKFFANTPHRSPPQPFRPGPFNGHRGI